VALRLWGHALDHLLLAASERELTDRQAVE
jgi:hypothetical protein